MRFLVSFFLIFVAATSPAAAAATHNAPKSTATVKLLADTVARAYPGGGKVVAEISATTPLTGTPTTLPVIGRADTEKGTWLRVRLPQKPNGSTGWISADGTKAQSSAWYITVNVRQRKATVYHSGKVERRFRVVVGNARTPTSRGTFFIVETVRQPKGAVIGPWALALSAYSNVLQEFDGGPGQIAFHGRTGLPDPLGSAASHGCVRFSDSAISWMAKHVAVGTTVRVR